MQLCNSFSQCWASAQVGPQVRNCGLPILLAGLWTCRLRSLDMRNCSCGTWDF